LNLLHPTRRRSANKDTPQTGAHRMVQHASRNNNPTPLPPPLRQNCPPPRRHKTHRTRPHLLALHVRQRPRPPLATTNTLTTYKKEVKTENSHQRRNRVNNIAPNPARWLLPTPYHHPRRPRLQPGRPHNSFRR